jgi:hypothetical protein
MRTKRLIHVIYSIFCGGTLLIITTSPGSASSLPTCLRVVSQSSSSVTVRNDCNKNVRYIVVSPLAYTFCQLILPREIQITRLQKISGIRSC